MHLFSLFDRATYFLINYPDFLIEHWAYIYFILQVWEIFEKHFWYKELYILQLSFTHENLLDMVLCCKMLPWQAFNQSFWLSFK